MLGAFVPSPVADPGRSVFPLLRGSPALDAGDGTSLGDQDQRALARIAHGAVDLGAVEGQPPSTSVQPTGPGTVAVGDAVTLSVTAANPNSDAALTYQWRKDGAAPAGQTALTPSTSSAQLGDAGTYDVVVSNELFELASDPVTLDVEEGTGSGSGSGGGTGGDDCSSGGGSDAGGSLALLAIAAAVALRRRAI